MITYNRILAVVQPDKSEQPALSRAIEIAKKTGAEVHALLVVYDFSYDMTTMLTRAEREAMRKAVTNDRKQWAENTFSHYDGCPVKVSVVWNDKRYEAIIRYAVEQNIDLVVKSTRQHHELSTIIFTPRLEPTPQVPHPGAAGKRPCVARKWHCGCCSQRGHRRQRAC